MIKPKRWLTYAWKDNEDAQVDHVYHQLTDAGLDVRLDRMQLTVGKQLWPQIDAGITDPKKCDGWAIYATKKSLESEPCLEEIAYALDRALRKRENDFPIIGIFPESLDRELLTFDKQGNIRRIAPLVSRRQRREFCGAGFA